MEKAGQTDQISRQRKALALTSLFLITLAAISVALVAQKRKLRATYVHLFHSYKEMELTQRRSDKKEAELRAEIAKLRNIIDSHKESAETADSKIYHKEGKTQSADKLADSRRKEILSAVEKALGSDELICDPDFSINTLAEITGYNTRYLSQVMNDEYACNFRTKVNEYRMNIAKRRILDIENYGHLTIQAIADSVGFRSQSGFVQVFKKHTGLTPSMFQKMARNDT